ncbi:unnamed protein product [Rotaria sordida]|uniref:DNA-directed RNA polymerase n=1 Tax=Rotaria sordida TaxID=392033 RepID=A0A816FI47_9BILA|nr:unnamed protein product [Rotaria sordida]CAF1661852.1 unnamed protein product [Rotaria sordida]
MYMMGKRVNYAGRSVISPDTFIAIYQVGIPEIFAKKLTYPELVTRHNVDELRQLILNGPDVHSGGNFVELEDETIRRLLPNNLSQRTACYRHLRTGDYVLVNRQPRLHRPNGTPLTGLIQDHVLAGRTLTMRDRVFEKSDYQQLLYNAIGSDSRRKIHLLPPCIWKAKQLWTGKQGFLCFS